MKKYILDEVQLGKMLKNTKDAHVKTARVIGFICSAIITAAYFTALTGFQALSMVLFMIILAAVIVYAVALKKYFTLKSAEKYLYKKYPEAKKQVYGAKKGLRSFGLYLFPALGMDVACLGIVVYAITKGALKGSDILSGVAVAAIVGFWIWAYIYAGALVLLTPKLGVSEKARKTMLKIADSQKNGNIYLPMELYPEKKRLSPEEVEELSPYQEMQTVAQEITPETASETTSETTTATEAVNVVKETVKTMNWVKVAGAAAAVVVVVGGGAMLLNSGTEAPQDDQIADAGSNVEGNVEDYYIIEDEDLDVEEEEPDVYNINGQGFSIGQDCLNVYLEYVRCEAEDAYKWADIKEMQVDEFLWEDRNETFGYFAIAGMCDGEPYLLLSSTNKQNQCGDETYFVTYTEEDFSGEGIDQTHMQGNSDIMTMDMYFRVVPDITTLYVCTDDTFGKTAFIYREESKYYVDGVADSSSVYYKMYGSYGKMSCTEVGSMDFDRYLQEGKLAEIKWFSKDQLEEARAYYQQFVREDVYDGPVETVNRADYFNNNTVLKYFEYFEDGVLEVEGSGQDTLFKFTGLTDEMALGKLLETEIPNSVEFRYGTDTTDAKYNIIENKDGTWIAVFRQVTLNKYGYKFYVRYETREDQVLNAYANTCAGEERPKTIQELVKRLSQ